MRLIIALILTIFLGNVQSQSIVDITSISTHDNDVKAQLFLYDYGFAFTKSEPVNINGKPYTYTYYSQEDGSYTNTVIIVKENGVKYFSVQYLTYKENTFLKLMSDFIKVSKLVETKESDSGYISIYKYNNFLCSFVASLSQDFAGKILYQIAIVNTEVYN